MSQAKVRRVTSTLLQTLGSNGLDLSVSVFIFSFIGIKTLVVNLVKFFDFELCLMPLFCRSPSEVNAFVIFRDLKRTRRTEGVNSARDVNFPATRREKCTREKCTLPKIPLGSAGRRPARA